MAEAEVREVGGLWPELPRPGIVVKHRGDGTYQAEIAGQPEHWEHGPSPTEAIAKLLVSHAGRFGMEIGDRTLTAVLRAAGPLSITFT
jgi:hypothetical protein